MPQKKNNASSQEFKEILDTFSALSTRTNVCFPSCEYFYDQFSDVTKHCSLTIIPKHAIEKFASS